MREFGYSKDARSVLHVWPSPGGAVGQGIIGWSKVTWWWINVVCFSDYRRRRVSRWSTPWRSAPTGCTRRSSMTASVCRSTRTAPFSATSAAAWSRCCHTKLVWTHAHTHTHAQEDSNSEPNSLFFILYVSLWSIFIFSFMGLIAVFLGLCGH